MPDNSTTEDPKPAALDLFDFYDPETLSEVLTDLDWNLRRELETYVEVASNQTETAQVRIGAAQLIRKLVQGALVLQGRLQSVSATGTIGADGRRTLSLTSHTMTAPGIAGTTEQKLLAAFNSLNPNQSLPTASDNDELNEEHDDGQEDSETQARTDDSDDSDDPYETFLDRADSAGEAGPDVGGGGGPESGDGVVDVEVNGPAGESAPQHCARPHEATFPSGRSTRRPPLPGELRRGPAEPESATAVPGSDGWRDLSVATGGSDFGDEITYGRRTPTREVYGGGLCGAEESRRAMRVRTRTAGSGSGRVAGKSGGQPVQSGGPGHGAGEGHPAEPDLAPESVPGLPVGPGNQPDDSR